MSAHTALCCNTCNVAISLEKVPVVVDEAPEMLARRIAAIAPEELSTVVAFIEAHQGHKWAAASVESIEEWRKRS